MGAEAEQNVVTVLDGDKAAPLIFVCEHASHYIPYEYRNLGLDDELLKSHIAWDPGAKELTYLLSQVFKAPAILSEISRLIYDCNRPPEAHDNMPSRSEKYAIPGNENLSDAERQSRIDNYYEPFKQSVSDIISEQMIAPMLVTIHSFTPQYHDRPRDVEIGILCDADSRAADAMLSISSQIDHYKIERNQPYGPEDGVTHTLKEHGIKNGLPNVMIEVRNDLLRSEDQLEDIAHALTLLIKQALNLLATNDKKASAL